MSEILKGKHFTCLYNYSRALEMLIGRRLLNIYLLLSLYHVFVVSQGPIRPVSYHVTSFSRLLKQQIAVFVLEEMQQTSDAGYARAILLKIHLGPLQYNVLQLHFIQCPFPNRVESGVV